MSDELSRVIDLNHAQTFVGPAHTENESSWQARRMLVGHCPSCGMPTVVLNCYETWPLIICPCGKRFATTEIVNYHRIEWPFIINNGTPIQRRPDGRAVT